MLTEFLRAARTLIVISGFAVATIASAQNVADYPNKPVKIVLPYLAGGGPDTFARMLAERLSKRFGQPVIVDNKPGASGAIGAQSVATAPKDGYTLLMAVTGLVQVPSLVPNPTYDPIKDFSSIAHLGGTHLALIINAQQPANSVSEFIAYVKSKPKKINYASYGVASLSHIFGEIFNDVAGLDLTHIAYKGDGPALIDILENRVESGFLSVLQVRQHVATGKLKVLAVTGTTRSPLMPNVPTFSEAGVNGLEAQGWFGLLAPAGTPAAVQQKIGTAVNEILREPDVRSRLLEMGIVAGGSTPEEFSRLLQHDARMYRDIFKKYNITLN